MPILGRSGYDHPALAETPASTVYSKIETIYTSASNDQVGRYFARTSIANNTSVVLEHGFGVNLSELKVRIYTGAAPSMTVVANYAAAGWSVIETPGNERTRITVTTPTTGGPHTFVVWLVHAKGAEYTTELLDVASGTPTDGQFFIYSTATSKWTPSHIYFKSEAAAINSGAIAPTTLAPLQVITGTPNDLQTIPNPTPGKIYCLFNNTGSSISVKENTGLTAANRIYTGSSGGSRIKDKSAAIFVYSSEVSRWIMIGGGSSSSSGGKNYSSFPDDSTEWVGSVATVATETNLTLIPENNTKTTALSITGTGYASNKFINIDKVDYNKTLQVQFYASYAGAPTEYTVEVYSYASTANRTAGTSQTQLPVKIIQRGANSIFTFVSNTQQYLEIRIVKTASTAIYISGFSVDAGQIMPMTGPSEWIQYSPITDGFGTISSEMFEYRSNGSGYDIRGSFLTGTPTAAELRIGLPNNHTTQHRNNGTNLVLAGLWNHNASNTSVKNGGVFANNGATYINFGAHTAPTGTDLTIAARSGTYFPLQANQRFTFFASVSVAELTGAATYIGQGAQPVYAYNSSTSTASDTTSFSYGEDGALVQAFVPTGINAISKTVRCPYPNPKFAMLQVKPNNRNWVTVGDSIYQSATNDAGNTRYGMSISPTVNSTDYVVNFYSAVDAVSGNTWSAENSVGTRWRVVFADTPAAVGFGTAGLNTHGLINPSDTGGFVYSALTTSTAGNAGVSNVNTITQNSKRYLRIGNQVTVFASFTIGVGATGITTFDVGLPVPSNFPGASNLSGSAGVVRAGGASATGGYIEGSNLSATRTARVFFNADAATSFVVSLVFSYEVVL